MVGEFPELQGVMGREYALHSGETPEVALAILEHYLPRSASDALPTQDAGALLGLADRLDTICGHLRDRQGPDRRRPIRSGCAAPAWRSSTSRIGRGYRYSLSRMVERALSLLSPKLGAQKAGAEAAVQAQILEFFRGRLKSLWAEDHRADVIEAVLAAGFDDLVAAKKRLDALSALVGRADFAPLAVAFKRVANIVEKQGKDVASRPGEPGEVHRRRREEPPRRLHPGRRQGPRARQARRLRGRAQGDHRSSSPRSTSSSTR